MNPKVPPKSYFINVAINEIFGSISDFLKIPLFPTLLYLFAASLLFFDK